MYQSCRALGRQALVLRPSSHARCLSMAKSEARSLRNRLFDEEKQRQRESVGRVEKIRVKYENYQEERLLIMNKDLSTPYDCTLHVSEGVANTTALAEVDGSVWDMHRPLTSDCSVRPLNLLSPSVGAVNSAFWRTCSLLLGAVADDAFKEDTEVHLHSFPVPSVKSGSFTYDVHLGLDDWRPTNAELRALSAAFVKLASRKLPVERLETSEFMAMKMFQENPFKTEQIPEIAKNNEGKVVLYRVGEHVDISKGPMVGNTQLVGRSTVASVHKVQSREGRMLYRFQGVSLPSGVMLNQFAYGILEERARKLNLQASSGIPMLEEEGQREMSAMN